MAGIGVEVTLKASASLVSGLFAAMLLAGGRRSATARHLGVFLALIALNQALEALRAYAADPVLDRWAYRGASVAAALDPLALLAFASEFARRPLPMRPLTWAGAAVALGALVSEPPTTGEPSAAIFAVAWAAYTAIAYALALVAVRGALADRRDDRGLALVLLGLAVAVVPVWPRIGDVWRVAAGALDLWAPPRGANILLAVVPLLLLAGARGPRPPVVARAALLAAAFTLVLRTVEITQMLQDLRITSPIDLRPWAALGASMRWLAFGALASVGVFRHPLVDLAAVWRTRAARVMVAGFFLVGALSALVAARAIFGDASVPLQPFELALLLLALGVSQGVRGIVDRVANGIYGVGAERTARPPKASPLEVGQLVADRYRILGFLGRGGAGRTFLAEDAMLKRTVAIKEIVCEPARLEEALQEARVAAGLHHPRVVTVFDVLARRDAILIVMERAAGGDLLARLAEGPLRGEEGLRAIRGVLEGLAALHAIGVVHGDIKPSNVLLRADGSALLADFGIAAPRATTRAVGTVAAGTPEFMAPEARAGAALAPTMDVYAAGLLAQVVAAKPWPAGLEPVVARALAQDPGARWRDAGEMLAAWDAALRAAPGT